jgi:hypothetical protein
LETGNTAKNKRGLGLIRLIIHNDALLMKHLHKFYSREDLPWVHLIWEKYYTNGKVSGHTLKGSFWWRGLLRLLNTFKEIAKR